MGQKNDSNNAAWWEYFGVLKAGTLSHSTLFFLVLLSWELIIAHIAECEHFLLEVSMCAKTDDSSP